MWINPFQFFGKSRLEDVFSCIYVLTGFKYLSSFLVKKKTKKKTKLYKTIAACILNNLSFLTDLKYPKLHTIQVNFCIILVNFFL